MIDRTALEKEVGDVRRMITQIDRDIRQLRDWISTNERSLASQPATLRQITEDGLARARGDLAQREGEARLLRENLATRDRLLGMLTEIDRKQREIAALERDQERITVLLERHRSELLQLQGAYEQQAAPSTPAAPSELVLPNNSRIPLDSSRGEYLIGWGDGGGHAPEIDLAPYGGGTLGVSRAHAVLRSRNGQWDIEDLGSTNGTTLNGTALPSRVPTTLADRTTISVGSLKLFFRYITQTVRL